MRLNYKVSLHLSVTLVRNCWHSSLLLHPSRDNYRSEFYDTIHLADAVFSAIYYFFEFVDFRRSRLYSAEAGRPFECVFGFLSLSCNNDLRSALE